MDWLTFTSTVIEAMAWPLAALCIGLMFREQIGTLLGKIRSAKGAGIEIDFSADVRRMMDNVRHVPLAAPRMPEPAPTMTPPVLPSAPLQPSLAPAAPLRPSARILEGWHDVVQAIQSFGSTRPLPAQIQLPLQELRELRNRVAAMPGFEPSEADAQAYLWSASRVIDALGACAQK